jgi:A/G-specific adenine glycosylase
MTSLSETLPDFSSTYQERGLTAGLIRQFQEIIYDYYATQGRDLPWRRTHDPYAILVSEIMLQQTQVERVVAWYEPFLQRFPGFQDLARASLGEILQLWQGLGYNRRAQALQRLAQRVVQDYGGQLPAQRSTLESLPGIGAATAGALLAFAFAQPVVFVETNIRRVYLHFFYPGMEGVTDKMLAPLIFMTLDAQRVRPWYYALMDYGAMLKKVVENPNRRSAHYLRQTPFPGSDRELRSRILRCFLKQPDWAEAALLTELGTEPARSRRLLQQLVREKFLLQEHDQYRLATGQEESGWRE